MCHLSYFEEVFKRVKQQLMEVPSTMNDVFVNIEGCDVRVLPD